MGSGSGDQVRVLEEALRASVAANAVLRGELAEARQARRRLVRNVEVLNRTVDGLTAQLLAANSACSAAEANGSVAAPIPDLPVPTTADASVQAAPLAADAVVDARPEQTDAAVGTAAAPEMAHKMTQVENKARFDEEWRWMVPILTEYGLWVPAALTGRAGDEPRTAEDMLRLLLLLLRKYEMAFLRNHEMDRLVSVPRTRSYDDWLSLSKLVMLPPVRDAPHPPSSKDDALPLTPARTPAMRRTSQSRLRASKVSFSPAVHVRTISPRPSPSPSPVPAPAARRRVKRRRKTVVPPALVPPTALEADLAFVSSLRAKGPDLVVQGGVFNPALAARAAAASSARGPGARGSGPA
ncbi:uncharacterized protein AMSG_04874 [Thecamonas trahens ATCC 50062]|uniref:Uncharacterized protein n=1 Tax=Thecamonas trahens ATCC 50062 TaxID=461836 RepID=A0A0L0D7R3_THETB|nr:hypothetical protein AMSG_04874 [Thecamonas trahens ATCC 50062]KNC48427.1 hypothetical protein AMSG_04874 [Thecamonas trahens ATCC 50062]|eukprot:XP_013758542.1 hypothetical protein AMSG_04874 [Thecamonas trahens ATCC 50062]